jgi:hypothetical protein
MMNAVISINFCSFCTFNVKSYFCSLNHCSNKYAQCTHLSITHLACGVTSSDADVGDGKRSTSTLGSALMAASRTLGRRCSGGGDMGAGGEGQGDSFTTGTGLAGGGVGDSGSGLVDTTVVFWATGGKDAADTTCRTEHIY